MLQTLQLSESYRYGIHQSKADWWYFNMTKKVPA